MSNALRIVVFSALSDDSGSSIRGRLLARALERAGARVTFLRNTRSLPLRLDYPLSMLHYLRALAIPCDVIVGLKPLPNVTLVLLAKRLLGAFTVLDIDDNDFGFRGGFVSRLNRALQLPFPRQFDLVTYHSPVLRDFILSTYRVNESRLWRLRQGVDTDTFVPQAWSSVSSGADGLSRRRALRSLLGLDALREAPLIAYPAHLNVACELPAILDIFCTVRARRPDARLLVIGGGPLERRYRRLVERSRLGEAVWFTGRLSPQRVVQYLIVSDVGVCYYRDVEVNRFRESMKLREMLALGLPVVCNAVGDLATFAAYTYQTENNPDAMGAAITRVLDRIGVDDRSWHGAEAVTQRMRWDVIGRELFEHLKVRRCADATAPTGIVAEDQGRVDPHFERGRSS
jgi:glycosyltransferase involved in cell wall biosynthesis